MGGMLPEMGHELRHQRDLQAVGQTDPKGALAGCWIECFPTKERALDLRQHLAERLSQGHRARCRSHAVRCSGEQIVAKHGP